MDNSNIPIDLELSKDTAIMKIYESVVLGEKIGAKIRFTAAVLVQCKFASC